MNDDTALEPPPVPEPLLGEAPVDLPAPLRNRAFLAFLATQFLGAFNDNVFKQAVLVIAVAAVKVGTTTLNFQAIVQALFTLPFVLFSGLAGELADRYSKGTLVVICKAAEIVVMAAGIWAFAQGNSEGALWALAVLAFVMGAQSAFFGPPKYALIPEIVRHGDIAPASGFTQMTTMIAIIVGIWLGGVLVENVPDQPELIGWVCCAIAVIGTLTSLAITRNPPAAPDRRVRLRSTMAMFPTMLAFVRRDHLLALVVLAYSYFWGLGAMVLTVINDYGQLQLGLGPANTSLLVATISGGIAVGSVVGGLLSAGGVRLGLTVPGIAGLAGGLIAIGFLPVPAPGVGGINHGEAAEWVPIVAGVLLFVLGAAGGMFSLPLLAFVQNRPVARDKGRVIAASAFVNWVFILASAGVYALALSLFDRHCEYVFLTMGIVTVIVGVVLLPPILRRDGNSPQQFELADAAR